MPERYNIAPAPLPARWFYADQIRAAAATGLELWLNVGKHYPRAHCRLSATVSGWCTVVLDNGSIIQAWAGDFVHCLGGY